MCYGSGSWCLSTWKVSLVMLRAVETFWEIFRICKTPGFLQHSWRLSIGDSYWELPRTWSCERGPRRHWQGVTHDGTVCRPPAHCPDVDGCFTAARRVGQLDRG